MSLKYDLWLLYVPSVAVAAVAAIATENSYNSWWYDDKSWCRSFQIYYKANIELYVCRFVCVGLCVCDCV